MLNNSSLGTLNNNTVMHGSSGSSGSYDNHYEGLIALAVCILCFCVFVLLTHTKSSKNFCARTYPSPAQLALRKQQLRCNRSDDAPNPDIKPAQVMLRRADRSDDAHTSNTNQAQGILGESRGKMSLVSNVALVSVASALCPAEEGQNLC